MAASGSQIEWAVMGLDAMPANTLYAVAQLRSEVFVVEQECVFLDLDGSDDQALHVLGYKAGELIAYARCFAPGVKFAEASIGRIATRLQARGNGFGHHLVERAKSAVTEAWGSQPVRIGAQARLKPFYELHGFVDMDKPYIEDGIDHLEMLWKPLDPPMTGNNNGK